MDNQEKKSAKPDNRTITCSTELRDRIKIMAATQRVQMRDLVEGWFKEKLEEAGF